MSRFPKCFKSLKWPKTTGVFAKSKKPPKSPKARRITWSNTPSAPKPSTAAKWFFCNKKSRGTAKKGFFCGKKGEYKNLWEGLFIPEKGLIVQQKTIFLRCGHGQKNK